MEWVLVERDELTRIWQLVGILGPRQPVGSGLILKIDQTEQSVTCWGKVPPDCAFLDNDFQILPKVSWISEHESHVKHFRMFGEERW